MYAMVKIKPVKAVMTFATSTVTFTAICAFMDVFHLGTVTVALRDRVRDRPHFDGY